MNLELIKHSIRSKVEITNDEALLLEIEELLTTSINVDEGESFDWERTDGFRQKIELAQNSIKNGNGITHEDALKILLASFNRHPKRSNPKSI